MIQMTDAIYVSKSDILDLITENNEAGGFTDYSNYSNLWDEVDNMPATNVQPVKRGRWENEYLEDDIWWAECSNCKQETHSRYGRPSTYRYCPNCGARMDGDT